MSSPRSGINGWHRIQCDQPGPDWQSHGILTARPVAARRLPPRSSPVGLAGRSPSCATTAWSSFLGETARDLRKVFEFVSASVGYPVCRNRCAGNGARTLPRSCRCSTPYNGRSLIIAATNHERMLDSAICHRFDEVVFLKPPMSAQLCRLLAIKMAWRVQLASNLGGPDDSGTPDQLGKLRWAEQHELPECVSLAG